MLARRIERAESELVGDIARGLARRERAAGSPGAERTFVVPLGGGLAISAGAESPVSKWIGLGLEGALDEREVERAEQLFAAAGTPVRVELCELADPSVFALFARRGYREIGREDVLALALDGARVRELARARESRPAAIEVREVAPEGAARWLEIVVEGFLAPDGSASTPPTESFAREALERVFADTLSVEGFALHLAFVDGAPAGGGGSRRRAGVVQLCGASTLPAMRGCGVQTALQIERLLAASRAGADLAVVTTEPDSSSQRNARARAFERVYARRVLVRG